jgi:ribosome-binding protein aMBF1 (putative translation factor)
VKSVAEVIIEQGLSIDQLVEKSGLEESIVTAIATGGWTPSPRQRQQIAHALGMQVDQIVWGHKTPVQHIWGQGPG